MYFQYLETRFHVAMRIISSAVAGIALVFCYNVMCLLYCKLKYTKAKQKRVTKYSKQDRKYTNSYTMYMYGHVRNN